MPRKILFLAIASLALVPAGRAAADAEQDRVAAQRIAQELKESGQLRDYKVGVKYQDGVAWLMGTVTSAEQKILAERLARQSAGVDRVISKLEVASARGDENVRTAGGVNSDEYQMQASAPTVQRMPARNGRGNTPMPYARSGQGPVQPANYGAPGCPPGMGGMGGGMSGPSGMPANGYTPTGMGQSVSYENPQMPGYAWPSYASYPNYAAVTYPQQYSPSAWPYIGPFYPYPQVPLGWRKVTLEWDDGWWFLDFKDCKDCH
jgi:hypothetical protein